MHTMDSPVLSGEHYKLIALATAAIMIGFIDFLAFWYNVDIISSLFFSPQSSPLLKNLYILAMFVSGYLSRPLGAIVLGRWGDRRGRKFVFLVSLFGLSIFTLLIALLPTYQHLGVMATLLFVIARLGQGMMFGSQLPIAWVYLSEHLPLRNVGFGGGIVTAGSCLGALVLLGLLYLLDNQLTQAQMFSYGWRIPFVISGMLGLVLCYFMRNLSDAPTIKPPNQRPTFKKRWQGFGTVLALSWFFTTLITIVLFLIEDLIRLTFLIDNTILSISFIICLIFLIAGCVFFGFLTDRSNAGRIFAIALSLFILSTLAVFYDLRSNGTYIIFSFAVFGFFGGVIGCIPTLISRVCPKEYRLSTIAIAYNSVYVLIGIFTPVLLGFFTYYVDVAPALYLSFLGILMLFLSFYLYYVPKENIHELTITTQS